MKDYDDEDEEDEEELVLFALKEMENPRPEWIPKNPYETELSREEKRIISEKCGVFDLGGKEGRRKLLDWIEKEILTPPVIDPSDPDDVWGYYDIEKWLGLKKEVADD